MSLSRASRSSISLFEFSSTPRVDPSLRFDRDDRRSAEDEVVG